MKQTPPDKDLDIVGSQESKPKPSAESGDDDEEQNQYVHVEKLEEEAEDKSGPARPSTAKKQGAAASNLQKELEELDDHLLKPDPPAPKKLRPKSNDIMGMKAFLTEVTPPHTPGVAAASAQATRRAEEPQTRDFVAVTSAPRDSEELPQSSYGSRPSTSDLWKNWRPKLKFGPRPVTESKPVPSANDRQKLPVGYKAKHAKPDRDARPKSRKGEKQHIGHAARDPQNSPRPVSKHGDRSHAQRTDATLPPVPPLSTQVANGKDQLSSASPNSPSPTALPQWPQSAKLGKATSGYSEGRDVRRPPGLGISSPLPSGQSPKTPKSAPAISPEKQRLMRALQMRKQQQDKIGTDGAPTPSMPQAESPGHTSGLANSVKNDSGVEVETSRSKSDAERSSPVTAPRGPLASPTTGRMNPLSSHPVHIHTNMPFSAPKRQHSNSPALSSGSNKELPKLPKEADKEQVRTQELPVREKHRSPPVQSQSSKRRKTSPMTDAPPAADSPPDEKMVEPPCEPATAPLNGAAILPAPSAPHNRHVSSTSGAPTGPSSSQPGEKSGTRDGRTPTPDRFPKPPVSPLPVTTSIIRRPSTSSKPGSNLHSEDRSIGSGRRTNMSSGISRRMQALSEAKFAGGRNARTQSITAYDSAQAFLAPGTLPLEESGARSTAVGRAYDASRSRSPHRRSTPRGLRPRASFDTAVDGEGRGDRTSAGPTGYRKRDSLTVTAHIMRPHHQQLRQLSSLAPSIHEERESPGDARDALHALAGGRAHSAATEPVPAPPLSPPPNGRLTFTRRESSGSTDMNKRPQSRGSAMSGLGRSSLDGWRHAVSAMRERRDSHSASGRRESHSSSARMRPGLLRASTHDRLTFGVDNEPMGLDRVDEVSETGTRASRTSRMLKRMSQLSHNSAPSARGDSGKTADAAGAGAGAHKGFQKIRAEKMDVMRDGSTAAAAAVSHSVGGPGKTSIVGDVNVQFPDTLLWKRRWVEVDAAGNLVLSPPASVRSSSRGGSGSQGGVRRFHLTDFRQPVVPSRDRQEMPHSVVLDLLEGGGTLQIASEDRVQQGALVKR